MRQARTLSHYIRKDTKYLDSGEDTKKSPRGRRRYQFFKSVKIMVEEILKYFAVTKEWQKKLTMM